jgi:transcriptional regulator with XRE-family HTH domain
VHHHAIWRTPAVQAALDSGNLGAIVRALRQANHLTLAQLAGRCGYSTSSLSRMERGKQPVSDVRLLRSIADALGIPPRLLGLAHTPPPTAAPARTTSTPGLRVGRVTPPTMEEADPVRRRLFLLATGAALTTHLPAFAAPSQAIDPARLLTQRLGNALLTPPTATDPVPLSILRQSAALAQREFTACDYISLAGRLPALLATVEATAGVNPQPAAHQVLAQTYNVITDVLIKLEASGLEWMSADRGLRAAWLADDPSPSPARNAWSRPSPAEPGTTHTPRT